MPTATSSTTPTSTKGGEDIGQFIDSPNAWGTTNRLTPEDDLETTELFGVADAAIGQLPPPLDEIIQLVDIDKMALPVAADALDMSVESTTAALNQARIHVRTTIDQYMNQ